MPRVGRGSHIGRHISRESAHSGALDHRVMRGPRGAGANEHRRASKDGCRDNLRYSGSKTAKVWTGEEQGKQARTAQWWRI